MSGPPDHRAPHTPAPVAPSDAAQRVVLLGALLMVALLCPFRVGLIVGGSLEPHISSRQPCLIVRDGFADRAPQRGDLVLLAFGDEYLVKFVAAVPGDEVFYGLDRVDDTLVRTMVPSVQGRSAWARGHDFIRRLVIPRGTVFVLGGNSGSFDSRDFGPIPLSAVRGQVIPVWRPLSGRGHVPFAAELYASGPTATP